MARLILDGGGDVESLAGALAAYYGEPQEWEAWKAPALAAVSALKERVSA